LPGAAEQPRLAAASLLVKTALADARVRELLGSGEPTVVSATELSDKDRASAYLNGETESRPEPRASLLLWNRSAGRAARVELSARGSEVLAVSAVSESEVPFVPAEVDEAFALAKANPQARAAIGETWGRYRLARPGEPAEAFTASALPVRSTDPKDPCSTHRCLEFIFRAEHAFLPMRVGVDLTTHSAQVVGSRTHSGDHP
jgi:hypothetical protein